MDNTGNVREWPSEEVLAYYLVQRENEAQSSQESCGQLRVMELGAGKSGLVGLVKAALLRDRGAADFEIVITDGNDRCVDSLRSNVALNEA